MNTEQKWAEVLALRHLPTQRGMRRNRPALRILPGSLACIVKRQPNRRKPHMENQKNKIMEEIRETISPEMKMRTEMSVAIANRIYDIMASKGLSQKDLAKRMGKTETEVSSLLSGTHKMPPSMIHEISSALNEDIMEDIVEAGRDLPRIIEENIYDDPTMLDVAASIINSMLVHESKKENQSITLIKMYQQEGEIIWSSNLSLRNSVLDKAINYYGPIVKARYEAAKERQK